MSKIKLETVSRISAIGSFLATVVIAILGFTLFNAINISQDTKNKLQTLMDSAMKTMKDNQESIEGSKPHYNLVVGFFDGEAKADPEIKERFEMHKDIPTTLDLRIWNISTAVDKPNIATRRADDVSCIVEFPKSFSVIADPYALERQPIHPQNVPQHRGGVIAGIDYGNNYALHPGTNFL